MIPYELYCRLRQLREQEHWTLSQIARELGLHRETVRHWLSVEYRRPNAILKLPKSDGLKVDILLMSMVPSES